MHKRLQINNEAELFKMLYTVEEAAQMLSLGRTRVYALLARKKIVSVQVGRTRLVPHSALVNFVEQLLQAS